MQYHESRAVRSAPAITIHRLSELPPRPRRTEIIRGLIAAGEIIALIGRPGDGKSALAVEASRAVADGVAFLGRETTGGRVIYLAAERHEETARRLKAAAGNDDPEIFLSRAKPQLADEDELAKLIAALRGIGGQPTLVIIDTLARCAAGLDENSSRDMGRLIDGLTALVEAFPGAAVLVVHHTTKAGGDLRGSSALLGAFDVVLAVEGDGGVRRLIVRKANAVAEGQALPFRLSERGALDGTVIAAEFADGAPQARRAASRIDQLLQLLTEMRGNGITERSRLLSEARNRKIYSGKLDATRKAFDRDLAAIEASR